MFKMPKTPEKRISNSFNKAKKDLEYIAKTNNKEKPIEHWCKEFFVNVLGYDKENVDYQENTCGRKAVDITIKDDKKQIFWLCECKKISENLNKWVAELQKYCCERNVKWGILTNGNSWRIYYFYHQDNNTPKYVLIYEIKDILRISNCKSGREVLFPFCIEALKKSIRENLLNKKMALSDKCFGQALLSKNVLEALRKQIKITEGFKIEKEEVVVQIKNLIPQFKNLKVSKKGHKRNSCRKLCKQKEEAPVSDLTAEL